MAVGVVAARAPRRVLDDAARRGGTVTVILASGRELTGVVLATGADAGEAVLALVLPLADGRRSVTHVRLDAVVAVIVDDPVGSGDEPPA